MNIKSLLEKMNKKYVKVTYIHGNNENGEQITRQQIIDNYIKQLTDNNIKFTIEDDKILYNDRFIFLPPENFTGIFNLRSKDYFITKKLDNENDNMFGNIPKKSELIEITENYFIKNANNNMYKVELI